MSETAIDHTPFLSDKFEVNDYAKAVLQGRPYRPDDSVNGEAKGTSSSTTAGDRARRVIDGQGEKGDVGVELAKLNYGIEDVTRQLRQEITTSYPLLLSHLTTSIALSSHLAPIRTSLSSLSTSLDRLHSKIHTPHEQLSLLVTRLALLAQAADLTRRAARYVLVARRLEGQMKRMEEAVAGKGEGERERELAKAALSVAELDTLLRPVAGEGDEDPSDFEYLPLDSLEFVKIHSPAVDKARDTIIQEMESMVGSGLADLNQPLLSSSLQTAHNLRLLPDLISNLLADLNDSITLRINRAFDSSAIGREVASKDGSSKSAINFTSRARQATEPTSSNQQQWVQVLWARLERVIEDISDACIKVYTLEKVLRMKKSQSTQMDFLHEVMKTLDDKPSFMFWTSMAKAFETQTKEAARSSSWLQQALSTGYPRLLRLFHDFFGRIAVHTDTVYTRETQSPEAVLMLRSVSTFETLYLTRATTRMNEAISSALQSYLSARGNPPGPAEGVNISRVIGNELDSAKFDPLLVRTVARNTSKVLDGFLAKVDGMLVRDFTATSVIGPNATAAQNVNAQVVGMLYHAWYNLSFLAQDFPGKVWTTLKPSVDALETAFTRVTDALDTALRREFSATIGRMHKSDFSKPVDPMAMGGGGSPYMQDLVVKVGFVKGELLGKMSLGDFMREWILSLARHIIRIFLLHASILRPLSESGKLKLTSDMTELEILLSSLLTISNPPGASRNSARAVKLDHIGDEYFALRSFRTLLFSDLARLANPVETVHLPSLVVLHHVVVLSPLRLPHEVHGWTEVEYVAWCGKHDDGERVDLFEKAINSQITATTGDDEEVYIKLIREIIEHARQAHQEGDRTPDTQAE